MTRFVFISIISIIYVSLRYYLGFDNCNRYGTYPISALAFDFLPIII